MNIKRNRAVSLYNIAKVLLIFLALSSAYFVIFHFGDFFIFAEENLSPDRYIEHTEMFLVRLFSLFVFGYIFLEIVRKLSPVFVPIESPMIIVCYGIVLSITLTHFFWHDVVFLFGEDKLFESITALLFFASSIILFNTAAGMGKRKCSVIILGLAILLFGLEEISWGQRLFGMETPEVLKKINHQKEINIHNIFTVLLPVVYVTFFSLLSIIFLFRDKFLDYMKKNSFLNSLTYLAPPVQFYYFGYIFLFLGGYYLIRAEELSEVIFSVFMVFYSIDLRNRLSIKQK